MSHTCSNYHIPQLNEQQVLPEMRVLRKLQRDLTITDLDGTLQTIPTMQTSIVYTKFKAYRKTLASQVGFPPTLIIYNHNEWERNASL